VQRLLAARSESDSRKALLTSGVVVLVQFTFVLLVGFYFLFFAQHSPLLATGERVDRILPLFLVGHMPVDCGTAAGIDYCSAMSNASGSLNSLAASSILDFFRGSGAAGRIRRNSCNCRGG